MSGHSKWATIKRQKGAADAKRGQLFTKLSNAITIAVKQGGGTTDSNSNFKLRLAIDQARGSNMPKENIERAINRAKGGEGASVEELLYEGFAPGGVAVIIQAVTDNKQRTVSEIKNIFEKNGGRLGSQGSVAYLFTKKGEIVVMKNGKTSEDLLNMGIEAGAEDMGEGDKQVYYYVDPADLGSAKNHLEEMGLSIENAWIGYIPLTCITSPQETREKVESLVEKLEELDDVQEVYTNLS